MTRGLEKYIKQAEEKKQNTQYVDTTARVISNSNASNVLVPQSQHTAENLQPTAPPSNIYNPCTHHAQPNTQNFRAPSPSECMESVNKTLRIARKFHSNMAQERLRQIIASERAHLSQKTPRPLQDGPTLPENMPLPQNIDPMFTSYISHLQDTNSLCAIGLALLTFGALAVATWNRLRIKLTEKWNISTALMFVQVSPAGTQKSFAISQLRKPFDDFQEKKKQEALSEHQIKARKRVSRMAYKEKDRELMESFNNVKFTADFLERTCKDMENFEMEMQHFNAGVNTTTPILLTDRTTKLGLALRLKDNGEAGACITAEGDFVNTMLLNNDSDLSFFNKCYDQEPYSADIANKKVNLKSPYFCMISFVQPYVLKKLLKKEELKAAGTMARIFPFFHTKRGYTCSTTISYDEAYEAYSSKIVSLLELYFTQNANAETYTVSLSNGALELVNAYKQELKSSRLSSLSGAEEQLNKLTGQAVRLAWAIHAWNNDIPHESDITKDEVESAIQFCRILEYHIEYCYSPNGLQAYKNAIKIMDSLKSITTTVGSDTLPFGYIKSYKLQQRTHIRPEDMRPALELLEKYHWLTICDNGNGSDIVILHDYFKSFPSS